MTTKIKYIIIATVGLLFGMSSCSSDGDEIVRTLDVDRPSIEVNKGSHVESVKVTVDKGVSFSAEWKGGAWGSVVADVQAGTVEITIEANNTAFTRVGSVIITLDGGFRNRVIEISQSADDIAVIPNEITFDFMGGEFAAKVESKSGNWTVESDVDWVKVISHLEADEIVVKALENTNNFLRSTTLTITAGTYPKEVTVKQDARPLFILPYMVVEDATFEKIAAFEEARYSSIVEGVGVGLATVAYTKSSLIPIITYGDIDKDEGYLRGMSMRIVDEFMPGFFGEGEDKGEVYNLLLDNNFEYLGRLQGRDYYWLYYGEDAKFHCIAAVVSQAKMVSFEAEAIKPILEAPTFDVFPYPVPEIPWGSLIGVTKTWEASNNGSLLEEDPEFLAFDVSSGLHVRRHYYYDIDNGGGLYFMEHIFRDITKILVKLPGSANYSINPALDRLILSEGFVFLGNQGTSPIYKHVAKDLEIMVSGALLSEEDDTVYGVISYMHTPASRRVAPKIDYSPHLHWVKLDALR